MLNSNTIAGYMPILFITSCIHITAPSPILGDPDSLWYLVTFTRDFTPILHINFAVCILISSIPNFGTTNSLADVGIASPHSPFQSLSPHLSIYKSWLCINTLNNTSCHLPQLVHIIVIIAYHNSLHR
jgi:hypothetical protein